MESLLNKKANVQLVVTGVTVLAIAGFVLLMGLIMLDDLLIETSDTTTTVTSESLATVDEAGETVANAGACGFNAFTVTGVMNETNTTNVTLTSGNYTTDSRQGIVYASATSEYNGTTWWVNYTYTSSTSEACIAANSTLEGQGRFGDYIDLIVLAVIIAVIISLIITGFAARRVQ